MSAVARACPVGARVVDSLPFSQSGTMMQAKALRAAGADGVALYLGVATPMLAKVCLAADLFVFGVTLASHNDGAAAVEAMRALGMPEATSCFLDLEGKAAWATPHGEIEAAINAWANAVSGGGFLPGLYVGAPQPLTSAELYALATVRYWHGQGSCRDRNNALAEPSCGWCMTQMYPSVSLGGVWVDHNIVGQDFHGRVPNGAFAVSP